MTHLEYETLMKEAVSAAKAGGAVIKELYESLEAFEAKDDKTPVTKADTEAQKAIIAVLTKLPQQIIAEEKENTALTDEPTWVIDPLDGTRDFLEKTGDVAVHIALCIKKEPVLGIVYLPLQNVLYTATKGNGAYRTKNKKTEKIQVNQESEFLVITRRRITKDMEHLINEQGKGLPLLRRGSMGLKMALVAEGGATITLNPTGRMKIWDVAAGAIIVKEAGGVVTDKEGKEIAYDDPGLFIANGLIARAV